MFFLQYLFPYNIFVQTGIAVRLFLPDRNQIVTSVLRNLFSHLHTGQRIVFRYPLPKSFVD